MVTLTLILLLLINCDPASIFVGGSLYNVALYKPAFQSSLYSKCFPNLGNDGNNTDVLSEGHCQHTLKDVWPWWMVDLKGQFVIQKIVLTNRGEYFSTLLRNFTIDVFKTDPRQLPNFPVVTGQICYSQVPSLTRGTFTWQCASPIDGRFVRLIICMREVLFESNHVLIYPPQSWFSGLNAIVGFRFQNEYLHMCEMELYVSNNSYKESTFIMNVNRMLDKTPIMTVHVAGIMACSQQCLSKREESIICTAFNWFSDTGECQLFQMDPRDTTILSSLVFQAGCNFIMEAA